MLHLEHNFLKCGLYYKDGGLASMEILIYTEIFSLWNVPWWTAIIICFYIVSEGV